MAIMTDLKFIILKINDKDANQLSENDVQMFLNTDDPITIELRRKRKDDGDDTQKDSTIEINDGLTMKFVKLSFSPNSDDSAVKCEDDTTTTKAMMTVDGGNKQSASIATQTQFELRAQQNEIVNCNRVIAPDQNIFDQCLAPELDIEEITLRKSASNERLGLTVCYSGGSNAGSGTAYGALSGSDENELSTDVFISDIQPDSIAYRDGRLRQGDQILQINGKDLKNKEETELLIAENNNAVTLLISRYTMYAMSFNDPFVTDLDLEENDDDDDEDEEEFYDENMPYENCFISNNCINVVGGGLDPIAANDGNSQPQTEKRISVASSLDLPDNVNDNKAAIGCTPKSDASAALREITAATSGKPVKANKSDEGKRRCHAHNVNNDYDTEHIYETIPEDSESEPLYCSPYESSMYVTAVGSCSSAVTEFEAHPQKQHVTDKFNITPDPDKQQQQVTTERNTLNAPKYGSHSNAHITQNAVSLRANERNSGSSGSTGIMYGNNLNDDHDNSSSAYNTGGSNNSVSPLTLVHREKSSSPKQFANNSAACKTNDCGSTNPIRSFNATETVPNDAQQKLSQKTMYTNEANLQQTMLLQQHILRQALSTQCPHAQEYLSTTQCPQFTAPNLSQYHFVSSQEVCASKTSCKPSSTIMISQNNTNDEAMVWKVKRRPDGTRYIVRRPVRNNRLVRERSLRLTADRGRNENTTTEEDTISEVKTGRYWSKEDRKKHIEKARERRQQQQQQQQQHHPQAMTFNNTTNSGVSTMRISDKSTLKMQPNSVISESSMSTRPPHMRLSRHSSTKSAQQYYQLQFNSCNGHQLAPAFVNGNNAVKLDSTNAPYVNSSAISNVHTRSPMNTAVRANVVQSNGSAMGVGVEVVDSSAQVPLQNYTNGTETSSSNNFLSVTTV